MDLDLVIRYNEWWRTGQVPARLADPSWMSRSALSAVLDHLPRRQALGISGLRRTGKSVLIYQAVAELLDRGWHPNELLYLSFDRPGASLEEALGHYERAVLRQPLADAERAIIFLDEVQKLAQWADRVKVYCDLYPQLKFVLSGSAALPLLRGAGDSLAGRAEFLSLHPCTFREFLALRGDNLALPVSRPITDVEPQEWRELADEYAVEGVALSAAMEDYLWHGGFPEIATERDFEQASRYVHSAVLSRVVHQDLPSVFPVRRPDVLALMVAHLCECPGELVRHDSLSAAMGIDRHTLADYLGHLEQACLIRMLWNYTGSHAGKSRKLRRAYPADVSLVAGHGIPLQSQERGRRLETVLVQHFRGTHFWRESDRYEVDLVLPGRTGGGVAIEVKNASRIDARRLTGLRRFATKRTAHQLVVAYSGPVQQLSPDPLIMAVPVWLLLAATEGVPFEWHGER